jgi:hypothetical protein
MMRNTNNLVLMWQPTSSTRMTDPAVAATTLHALSWHTSTSFDNLLRLVYTRIVLRALTTGVRIALNYAPSDYERTTKLSDAIRESIRDTNGMLYKKLAQKQVCSLFSL